MEEDFTYNVISSGELIDQFDLSQVQIDVAKLFNVDQGKANAFSFSSAFGYPLPSYFS